MSACPPIDKEFWVILSTAMEIFLMEKYPVLQCNTMFSPQKMQLMDATPNPLLNLQHTCSVRCDTSSSPLRVLY